MNRQPLVSIFPADPRAVRRALPFVASVAALLLVTFVGASPAHAVAPANDNLASAQVVTLGTDNIGTTVDATTQAGETRPSPCPVLVTQDHTAWYKYTADFSGGLTIDTLGSGFDTVLALYSGPASSPTIGGLTPVVCDDDTDWYPNNLTSRIQDQAVTAGTTYYIQVSGFNQASGSVRLRIGLRPSNDFLEFATDIGGVPSLIYANNAVALLDAGEPAIFCGASIPGTASLWYKYSPLVNHSIAIDTVGSGTQFAKIALFTGPASSPTMGSLAGVVCASFPPYSYFRANLTGGLTYYLQVSIDDSELAGNVAFRADIDDDSDVIPRSWDNCPLTANGYGEEQVLGIGNQADSDSDALPGFQPPTGSNWGGDACDVDDDNDDKPDTTDGCRTIAEDYDDFEDGDGCRDADNDGDGICDPGLVSFSCSGSDIGRYVWQNPLPATIYCKNVAEDYDGFHDDDGCPEPDNDYDTFPDHTDDCPGADTNAGPDGISDTGDEPALYLTPYQAREDFDGIIDWDGCHDSPNDDYDGDGLGDETEVFTIASDPVNPDTDGDGVTDSPDNCPTFANPAQNLPAWTVPANDGDCDGFNKIREDYMGTNPAKRCPNTAAANDEAVDAWPTDFNDSRLTSLADVVLMGPVYNQATGSDPAKKRFDLNASGIVSLADVVLMGPFYNKSCA